MKVVYLIFALCLCGVSEGTEKKFCKPFVEENGVECYVDECMAKINEQISEELTAAFSYMYLAARFDHDQVDRQGMAKFLYESASEERHHAIMMLDYLNKRGSAFNLTFTFSMNDLSAGKMMTEIQNWKSSDNQYKAALTTALNMEMYVTDKIYNIISECADDYHGADFFTEPILAEQHDGIRKLQGAIQEYDNLANDNGGTTSDLELVNYIFDGKMLSGVF